MKHLLKAMFAVVLIGGIAAVFHPDTPLREEWNPLRPLRVDAPVTPLTVWKLQRALGGEAQCQAALASSGAVFETLPAHEESEDCHIRPRVKLRQLGDVRVKPVDTRCQTALLMAMWERHGLQTAARRHLGQAIREIRHYSSYNCRKIRTTFGGSNRMSSHATADAIDVAGFVMADGKSVDLRRDWPEDSAKSAFLKDAFASSCLWFPVALGPEYNALHADHFHLQTRGWGLCK